MEKIFKTYDTIVHVIIAGLLLVMLATLIFAFVDVAANVVHLAPGLARIALDDVEFRELVTSVLDVFVIIELFGTIIGYVRYHRVRLSALIDVVAVFILRDMLIKIYAANFPANTLLVLALLLIVMVIARTLTNYFQPRPPTTM
ncbi:phosphate-starvation-inducible PsiE family protein [Bordetella sp. FB-8]|uniref:phosphate-starvation-inducible PsiE family protein n=1 Tax=Bordetella sp. FB-8 TaxID=1159870 RepID=UPI00036A0D70|nr:phosphate-starvation-inducible PsiE family protein [Bordetella sp. FB-8]